MSRGSADILNHPFVADLRPIPSYNAYTIGDTRTLAREGAVYQQNTANIGRKPSRQTRRGRSGGAARNGFNPGDPR
jgi:hypothetical protein